MVFGNKQIENLIKGKLFLIFLLLSNFSYSQSWDLENFNLSNSGLPSNNILSISVDNYGQVWAGTLSGIGKFSDNNWTNIEVNNTLNDETLNVWPIGDSIWVGTEFLGLWLFYQNGWTHYDENSTGNGVEGFDLGQNDTLFRIDKFGDFDKWENDEWIEIEDFISNPHFLFADSENTIWIGSEFAGLYRYFDGVIYRFRNNANQNAPDYIPADGFRKMVEDTDNNLWIGTRTEGLLKYDGTNWEVFNTPMNVEVLDIDIDQNNKIWLATTNGVMSYSEGIWEIINSTNSSLPDDRVVAIAVETENIIWASIGYNEMFSPPGGKGVVRITNTLTSLHNEKINPRFSVFPNPVEDIISIKTLDQNISEYKIKILDLNGNCLYDILNQGVSECSLSISNYPQGIYIVEIESSGSKHISRILKK